MPSRSSSTAEETAAVAEFTGKTALITGAGRGIGRAIAIGLAGTGVTVSAYRPGGVDTAMQAWIRSQDPDRIGAGLHERFSKNVTEGTLITPGHSAAPLLAHLAGDDTGAIWDVSTAHVRT